MFIFKPIKNSVITNALLKTKQLCLRPFYSRSKLYVALSNKASFKLLKHLDVIIFYLKMLQQSKLYKTYNNKHHVHVFVLFLFFFLFVLVFNKVFVLYK